MSSIPAARNLSRHLKSGDPREFKKSLIPSEGRDELTEPDGSSELRTPCGNATASPPNIDPKTVEFKEGFEDAGLPSADNGEGELTYLSLDMELIEELLGALKGLPGPRDDVHVGVATSTVERSRFHLFNTEVFHPVVLTYWLWKQRYGHGRKIHRKNSLLRAVNDMGYDEEVLKLTFLESVAKSTVLVGGYLKICILSHLRSIYGSCAYLSYRYVIFVPRRTLAWGSHLR